MMDFKGGSLAWSRQRESDGPESPKTVQVISQMSNKYLYVEEEYLYVWVLVAMISQMSKKYFYVEEEYLCVWV